jgi:hypothetical protein
MTVYVETIVKTKLNVLCFITHFRQRKNLFLPSIHVMPIQNTKQNIEHGKFFPNPSWYRTRMCQREKSPHQYIHNTNKTQKDDGRSTTGTRKRGKLHRTCESQDMFSFVSYLPLKLHIYTTQFKVNFSP